MVQLFLCLCVVSFIHFILELYKLVSEVVDIFKRRGENFAEGLRLYAFRFLITIWKIRLQLWDLLVLEVVESVSEVCNTVLQSLVLLLEALLHCKLRLCKLVEIKGIHVCESTFLDIVYLSLWSNVLCCINFEALDCPAFRMYVINFSRLSML